MIENNKALELFSKITKLEERAQKLRLDISNKRNKLEKICIHNDIEIVENYIPGGYLDRAEYITIKVCKVCRKELDRKIKYGGFN